MNTTFSVGAERAQAKRTVAVFIAHGMGQQIPFQTMDAVAQGLQARGGAGKATTRAVKHGEEWLHRIEMPLANGDVDVHLYEAYWAPLTEGRITLRDVIRFLAGAGRNAVRNARKGRFNRWLFGSFKQYPIAMRTLFYLLVTLASIGALVAMNTAITAVAAGTALLGSVPSWLTEGLLADLTTTFNGVVVTMAIAGVALFVGIQLHRPGGVARPRTVPRPIRLGWAAIASLALLAAIFAVVLAGVAIPLVLFLHIRKELPPNAQLWQTVFGADAVGGFNAAVGAGLYWFAAIVLGLVAARWAIRIGVGLVRDLFASRGALGSAVVATLFALLVVFAVSLVFALRGAADALPSATALAIQGGLVWLLLVGASGFIRQKLVQFLGDVAIYVMPYKLDAFNDLRREIKQCATKVLSAVFALKKDANPLYDSVIVVGHSLGSVVAYDALNQVIREDGAVNGAQKVVERTRMLLTFGSPLDKTAFIFSLQGSGTSEAREALAASVQPMITHYDFRPREWVNVWSPFDIISGHLGFYDDPAVSDDRCVQNRIDPDATTPIVAHTEYWDNPLIYEIIEAAATTIGPPVKAPDVAGLATAAQPAPTP